MESSSMIFSIFLILRNTGICYGDFYMGMFKKNDFLMARDTLYQPKATFGITSYKYGRVLPCPITYVSIKDKPGVSSKSTARVIRGGLLKNKIVLQVSSKSYINADIMIGCENPGNKSTSRSENPRNPENLKNLENLENPDDPENPKNPENQESLENLENLENPENIENVENPESPKVLENPQNVTNPQFLLLPNGVLRIIKL